MRYVLILTITLFLLSSFTQTKIQEKNVIHSVVDLSNEESRFANFATKLTENLVFLEDPHVNRCEFRYINHPKSDYYTFIPALQAKLKKVGDSVEFTNYCFQNNVASLVEVSNNQIVINIESSNPVNFYCRDTYVVTTSNYHDIKTVVFHGQHLITLKNPTQDDLDEIDVTGIRIFTVCENFFGNLKSLFKSLEMYVGGLGTNINSWFPFMKPEVPEYMEKANVDMLSRFINFTMEQRDPSYSKGIIDIDINEIKTGDFIAIHRLDGLDPLIMLGSGSHLGHSAVACWIDGELYVLESQDGWYWPKRNIQRNKWSEWVQWAHNADFHVAILPLKEEIRQKFDVNAAFNWFLTMEGHHYGYHNFLFGWIDVPEAFLPDLIESETLLLIFSTLGKISRSVNSVIIEEGLNLRLSTQNLSIAQATAEAARRNMTFEELVTLPEIDGWNYSDGPNYVCSSFVIGFYKAGGIFGDLEINATEFTPKDIYQLDIFDKNNKETRPQICKDADPDLEFCQIMGKYRINLPGYSSIAPYNRMNQRCPSVAPNFYRPDGC